MKPVLEGVSRPFDKTGAVVVLAILVPIAVLLLAVDESRISFGTGRDLRLNPPQAGPPLNYLMYPYAEADGKPLNEDLFGFNLGYTIRVREL
jgi:hypothetical protein